MKQVNIFEKKVNDTVKLYDNLYKKMFQFSRVLQKTMGISDECIHTAQKYKITWEFDDFTIFSCSYHLLDSNYGTWLSIIPMGFNIDKIPSSWTYLPNGTSPIILPPKNVQDIIVKRIKSKMREKKCYKIKRLGLQKNDI